MVSLTLEGVGTRYGRKQVLADVTTPTITAGTMTAVIGPNAAGKSSLFRRIAGMASGPGEVHIEGVPSGEQALAYLPQDTNATAVLTVFESVVLAAKQGRSLKVSEEELRDIDSLLAALRITELASRYLSELSGGQRQLVGIAQSLIRRPHILLMDEPTSALDLHRQMEVLGLVRSLADERQMIVMIALHDLNHALGYCDHALVIANGRMHRFGSCNDTIDQHLLREVYRVDGHVELNSLNRPQVVLNAPIY
ncbi:MULTISPECIES: ABC transporter ATP-binding protein [Larsenimonas]|uniref:ABC transporter ATP-binding protein n=1 Tax=Larsenimonas suaedae TaxID=1851019 RepID=A0ABU1GST1_9GAMM|nr:MULTISPECIES: ABC transporter ATP-binding protein [Larsenimonas]MCM2972568.1 ABC transporter ATP-binding protein [Larsenimonas suaedae]MCM5704545.1 ABC transporter ATP-binding protein [Larsenimonas salina]MDR5894636.1 ABC transporter ATP-binding protein [Larsenimonas suaedae]